MQKLKSKYEDTGAEVSSFCLSDLPHWGSGPTFPYRQCQLFFERQGYCLSCKSALSSKIIFGGFLVQFNCPVPSTSEHLPTASLQVTSPSTCRETPEGSGSAAMGLLGERQPPNSTIELGVSPKGCDCLSPTSCPAEWVKPGRSMSLKISSSF